MVKNARRDGSVSSVKGATPCQEATKQCKVRVIVFFGGEGN